MLKIITQSGLIITGVLSILISLITANNPVGSKSLGKLWIGVNLSLALWALPWCAGAFYLQSESWRWFSIYFASLCAIALPPLFLCFSYALLNRPIAGSKFIQIAWITTGLLLILCLCFPHQFFSAGVRKVRDAYLPTGGILLWMFSIQYVILFSRGVYLLIDEVRHLSGSQRNKIAYVIMGVAIGSGGGVTTFLTPLGIYPYGIVLIPCYSILITYAITRHRLLDIAIVIRKTLVYSVVIVSLVAVYLAAIALFARIFTGIAGVQTIFSASVAAALISFVSQPLRKRIQTFVDAKFFRQYVDREEKLYELSREVITHTTSEAMGDALMHVISEALHPKGGALYLRSRQGAGFVRVSGVGSTNLPARMEEDNVLGSYFKDHPQPFVQDLPTDVGQSHDTRRKADREDAA
jgi:hypothetical protein